MLIEQLRLKKKAIKKDYKENEKGFRQMDCIEAFLYT